MTIELCGVCGASWACEHRPVVEATPEPKPSHVVYSADARGNVVTSDFDIDKEIKYPALPTPAYHREELENMVAAIVLNSRKVTIREVVSRLGWDWQDRERKQLVMNTIARLVRRKVIYRGRSWGNVDLLSPYDIRTHRGEGRYLLRYIDESEMGYADRELRLAQARIERLKRKRGALQRELEKLGDEA